MTAKAKNDSQEVEPKYEVVTLVDAERYNFQSYVFKRNIPTRVRIGNAAYLLSQINEDTDERYFAPGAVNVHIGKKGRPIHTPVKTKEKDLPKMLTRVEQVYQAEKEKMEASLKGMPDSIIEWTRKDFEAKHGPKKDSIVE